MEADTRIPPIVANSVMASINAAANPDAEKVDVVIQTLDPAERAIVIQSAQEYMQTLSQVGQRGRMGLMGMTDQEWDDLVGGEE